VSRSDPAYTDDPAGAHIAPAQNVALPAARRHTDRRLCRPPATERWRTERPIGARPPPTRGCPRTRSRTQATLRGRSAGGWRRRRAVASPGRRPGVRTWPSAGSPRWPPPGQILLSAYTCALFRWVATQVRIPFGVQREPPGEASFVSGGGRRCWHGSPRLHRRQMRAYSEPSFKMLRVVEDEP
jgi:hypothetical protein